MNIRPTTNQRLVSILLILLIILVALLVIGIVAGFFMMGGWMRGGMMNPMMGGYNNNYANTKPLTVEQAKAAAEKYLANLNNSDMKITEVMIFNNNAYLVVKETSTGKGAFELLVDPGSQVAYPEYGPNMMWNLKYGCLNMAIQFAQKYLDANMSGAKAATDPTKFYGYYTLDFEKNGKVAGMLSVNGYSGEVFLHTWHGTFLEEAEIQ